jgi:membrane-associated phospholipid phosphatase
MDWTLFEETNDLAQRTGWAHGLAADYAKYGIVVFAGLLLAGLVVARRRGPRTLARSLWAGGAALVALLVNQPIGRALHRPRPYLTHPHVELLVARTRDQSFPSDHAVVVGAVAVGLLAVAWQLGVAAAVLAVGMAFARVYVGAHYPGDVVAGLLLGGVVAAIGLRFVDPVGTAVLQRLADSRIGAVLVSPRAAGGASPASPSAGR